MIDFNAPSPLADLPGFADLEAQREQIRSMQFTERRTRPDRRQYDRRDGSFMIGFRNAVLLMIVLILAGIGAVTVIQWVALWWVGR